MTAANIYMFIYIIDEYSSVKFMCLPGYSQEIVFCGYVVVIFSVCVCVFCQCMRFTGTDLGRGEQSFFLVFALHILLLLLLLLLLM